MKYSSAVLTLSGLVTLVHGHGFVTSPQARMPGAAMEAACGTQIYDNQEADNYGNIQGELQVADSTYNATACDIWLCKGYKYEDNTDNVYTYSAGEVIPFVVDIRAPHTGTANVSIVKTSTDTMISSILKYWSVYASVSTTIPYNNTNFNITMPDDLGDECTTGGECVIQWFWNAESIDQTYESCIDFTLSGSGSSSSSSSSSSSGSSSVSVASAAASTVATDAVVASSASPADSASTTAAASVESISSAPAAAAEPATSSAAAVVVSVDASSAAGTTTSAAAVIVQASSSSSAKTKHTACPASKNKKKNKASSTAAQASSTQPTTLATVVKQAYTTSAAAAAGASTPSAEASSGSTSGSTSPSTTVSSSSSSSGSAVAMPTGSPTQMLTWISALLKTILNYDN
ncbi:hypothetical protein ASPZODRAFT_498040 [Penicilliopsis zonata CBS 506.65]|uniref:Chitin-binding type-4 domain-containing protein n=1 Tax=Penicilliopsis zonata CBS 506.65 TaxID=1073090 RepID=A0A1L9SEP6_9EURO|nr:hypothetical protein ASPZODRAFT_498040 [Penicilliopsis zonata CBS 506.65]OJJ45639.1 hypothetical protein ASPZODRAFT_498040 [Penicilliopsis zonata CBS 506.65]